jgi:hypothetical protein
MLSRTSHPSGSRLGGSHEITPAPGTSCPRQPSGPGCVHCMQAQDVWLPEDANPIMAHNRSVSVPTPVAREIPGWRLRLIGSAGSHPNPFASSQLHPSSAKPSRRRGTHLTAPARATCDDRRAPAYGPPPSARPGDASGKPKLGSSLVIIHFRRMQNKQHFATVAGIWSIWFLRSVSCVWFDERERQDRPSYQLDCL